MYVKFGANTLSSLLFKEYEVKNDAKENIVIKIFVTFTDTKTNNNEYNLVFFYLNDIHKSKSLSIISKIMNFFKFNEDVTEDLLMNYKLFNNMIENTRPFYEVVETILYNIENNVKETSNNLVVLIKDEGPGFSETSPQKIFKRFFNWKHFYILYIKIFNKLVANSPQNKFELINLPNNEYNVITKVYNGFNNINYIKLRLKDSDKWGKILSQILSTEIIIINDDESKTGVAVGAAVVLAAPLLLIKGKPAVVRAGTVFNALVVGDKKIKVE